MRLAAGLRPDRPSVGKETAVERRSESPRRLSDAVLGCGMLAGCWNMDKDTAYRTRGLGTSD